MMILHSVYFGFCPDATATRRNQIIGDLAAFSQTLDGVLAFESGPNLDFEKKSQAYGDGFVIRFRDQAALETYAVHPTHQRLGGELCDAVVGGADGIIVFDLDLSAQI